MYEQDRRRDLLARRNHHEEVSHPLRRNVLGDNWAWAVIRAGVDIFVIRGTTVSAEHVSAREDRLDLKTFIYELDVPVIVGGCATYQAALHLMRTGAAGVRGASVDLLALQPCAPGCASGTSCDALGVCIPN